MRLQRRAALATAGPRINTAGLRLQRHPPHRRSRAYLEPHSSLPSRHPRRNLRHHTLTKILRTRRTHETLQNHKTLGTHSSAKQGIPQPITFDSSQRSNALDHRALMLALHCTTCSEAVRIRLTVQFAHTYYVYAVSIRRRRPLPLPPGANGVFSSKAFLPDSRRLLVFQSGATSPGAPVIIDLDSGKVDAPILLAKVSLNPATLPRSEVSAVVRPRMPKAAGRRCGCWDGR
jgi:hypothetical protein